MAEFPDLGEHCSMDTCRQLDFLPMKCDACKGTFCKDHIVYDSHKCVSSSRKNIQVPVCPLCEQPVSCPRGQQPDLYVGRHIDSDCKSDRAVKKRSIYTNQCHAKGCKKRELVPVVCSECRVNFCLRHRHSADHDCPGPQSAAKRSGAAAVSRLFSRTAPSAPSTASAASRSGPAPYRTPAATAVTNGNMTEDEALAQALAASLATETDQEEHDRQLAQHIQTQEYNAQQRPALVNGRQSRSTDRCDIS